MTDHGGLEHTGCGFIVRGPTEVGDIFRYGGA